MKRWEEVILCVKVAHFDSSEQAIQPLLKAGGGRFRQGNGEHRYFLIIWMVYCGMKGMKACVLS